MSCVKQSFIPGLRPAHPTFPVRDTSNFPLSSEGAKGERLSRIAVKKYVSFGCLFLLLVGSLSVFCAFRNVGFWLARQDAPVHADLIVCLNGEHRVAKAAQLYGLGWADSILLTVGETADVLVRKGVPESAVRLAPGVRTTFEEALAASQYVRENPAATGLVVSDPFHLARVRWSFGKTFRDLDTELAFVASDLPWLGPIWFDDPSARFQTVSELSKIVFYRAYYGLLRQKTAPDRVFALKEKYLGFLRRVLTH